MRAAALKPDPCGCGSLLATRGEERLARLALLAHQLGLEFAADEQASARLQAHVLGSNPTRIRSGKRVLAKLPNRKAREAPASEDAG